MDFQGALRARLVAAAAVTALVGTRIYWVERPQASALPSITLQTIAEERPQHMAGLENMKVSRVQIDCWASSYAQAQALAEAVIAAVVPENTSNGIVFHRTFIDSIRDLGERTETQFIHRASLDLIFNHNTV